MNYPIDFLIKVQAAVDRLEDEATRKFAHAEMSKALAAGTLREWFAEMFS